MTIGARVNKERIDIEHDATRTGRQVTQDAVQRIRLLRRDDYHYRILIKQRTPLLEIRCIARVHLACAVAVVVNEAVHLVAAALHWGGVSWRGGGGAWCGVFTDICV